MIRVLKLRKAVFAIILGVLALIAAQIMSSQRMDGSRIMLSAAGVLFVIGSFLFLYPILFAKKADNEGKKVELEPVPEVPIVDGSSSSK